MLVALLALVAGLLLPAQARAGDEEVVAIEVLGNPSADTILVSWGGTLGSITAAVEAATEAGTEVAYVHLRHLNPLPSDLGETLARYKHVLVPELNSGQLSMLIRARYLIDAWSYTKVNGQPFKVAELTEAITSASRGENPS